MQGMWLGVCGGGSLHDSDTTSQGWSPQPSPTGLSITLKGIRPIGS